MDGIEELAIVELASDFAVAVYPPAEEAVVGIEELETVELDSEDAELELEVVDVEFLPVEVAADGIEEFAVVELHLAEEDAVGTEEDMV